VLQGFWLGSLDHNYPMTSRAAAFVLWALVAATAVFWLLSLTAQGTSVPHAVLADPQNLPLRAELSRVLGSTPTAAAPEVTPPELSSRFVLSGVMAPKTKEGNGLALIAVDGQPPRPYSLGTHLDSNWVLLAVGLRSASIGPAGGPPSLTLELPLLPAATTGSLAPAFLDAPAPPPPPQLVAPPSRRPPFEVTAR
jgi:general secretion pathway protein C